LQIWLLPAEARLTPGYEQKAFPADERAGRLCLLGSQDGREGSVTIHQDVNLYSAVLDAGEHATLSLGPRRHVWAQVTRGGFQVNGTALNAGDGAAISEETSVAIQASAAGELLLFDLA
jgi:redox-sensitive bicupin YhaK (pirin superfamily)